MAVISPSGFEDWFEENSSSVVAALTVALGDEDRAVEHAAEAFARALERWDRVRVMESPVGWTVVVGLNHARRAFRSRRAERVAMRQGARNGHLSTIGKTDTAIVVREAVRRLPPRQREAVVLRYYLDLTEAETGASMGIAPGTVAATLSAARATLRRNLPGVQIGAEHDDQ